MILRIRSSEQSSVNKKLFALPLIVGVAGIAAVSSSGAVSAASLTDNLEISPAYQKYMADKNSGLGDKWVLIPNKYNFKPGVAEGRGNGTELPSSYNLIEAGYKTPQKNQGGDGDCWAYATTTAMESYMKKNMGVSIEFSPKQLDYIVTPSTEYGTFLSQKYGANREIGTAGSFILASIGLRSDYVLDREDVFFARMKANDSELANYQSFKQYNDVHTILAPVSNFKAYTKPMSRDQILGDKAEYLVDGFEWINKNDPDAVAKIKEKVYTKGAMYVGTFAPETENCWDENSDTIIDRDVNTCGSENGHAMAIVGWDDNHSYKKPDGTTGTGAFIVQNSYGQDSLFSDYGINSADDYIEFLREGGALDNISQGVIQQIHDAIAPVIENWDADETIYLAYDFEKGNNGTIEFAAITSMVKNDFDKVYDMTQATTEAKDGTFLNFKMKGQGEQDLTAVGLDLLAAQSRSINFTIGVDSNNDGISEYDQPLTFGAAEAGRRVAKLDRPIHVSGDFTLMVSAEGYGLTADNDGTISALAYTGGPAASPDTIPVPKTGSDITVPNTGLSTNDDNGVKFGGIVATLVGILTIVATAIAFKNRHRLHKIKFDKN